MLVTLSGIVKLEREVHLENVCNSMLVMLSGIVMSVSAEQPLKADCSMVVTLSGIVMLAKDLQSANACNPMLVTLLGIVMSVSA